jgi:hypothetical protein
MNTWSYIRNENQLMQISLENNSHKKASVITGGIVLFFALLLIFWKWKLPEFEKQSDLTGIEVELNLPPDPPIPFEDGGGGGGNPVEATDKAGIANPAPVPPGETEPSKQIEDDASSNNVTIAKTTINKPKATKITTTSPAKEKPKVVENPAPPRPKAVMGKTTNGTGNGGGVADNFEKSGGKGNGTGVGNGDGFGGGNGNGAGGGNGTGIGSGNGPRILRGDRKIVKSYSFDGDLNKATIYANVLVSPDGIGKFISIAKGSSSNNASYKEAIVTYLKNIKFNSSDHESMLTVQFNFRIN